MAPRGGAATRPRRRHRQERSKTGFVRVSSPSQVQDPKTAAAYAAATSNTDAWVHDVNQALSKDGFPLRVDNLTTVWTVLFTEPGRYHWMFQYYLRAEGLALSWVGTGRCLFSLDFTPHQYFRRADISPMNRGDAAAGTWIVHGDESRRRTGTLEGRTWAAARNWADPCSVGRRASCLRCRSEPERTPHRYAETKEAILAAADKMRKDGWWAGGATASAIGKKIAKEMLYQMVAQRVGLA